MDGAVLRAFARRLPELQPAGLPPDVLDQRRQDFVREMRASGIATGIFFMAVALNDAVSKGVPEPQAVRVTSFDQMLGAEHDLVAEYRAALSSGLGPAEHDQ